MLFLNQNFILNQNFYQMINFYLHFHYFFFDEQKNHSKTNTVSDGVEIMESNVNPSEKTLIYLLIMFEKFFPKLIHKINIIISN